MILAGEEERVIAQFNQLRERAIRRSAADHEIPFFHLLAVFHVELVTVAMALEHFVVLVDFSASVPGTIFGRPGAEAHASAFFAIFALLVEQTDDRFG